MTSRPSPKEVIDRHKPWFDYASCILGTCAWFVAIGSVAVLAYRSRMAFFDTTFILTFMSLVPATAYGFFLLITLYRMTIGLSGHVLDWTGDTGWKAEVVVRLAAFWAFAGLGSFVVALVAHFAWIALGLYQR